MMKVVVLVAALLIGGALLVFSAARSRDAAVVRNAFRTYLAEQRPDLTVVEETTDSLALRRADGTELGTVYLDRLYREVGDDTSEWPALFAKMIGALAEAEAAEHLGDAEIRRRILPRIVNEAFLVAARRELPGEITAVPLPVDGLFVVFVLDSPNSVAYLPADRLRELGLDPPAALALAKENLSGSLASAVVREVMESSDVRVVKTLDTYDAARLLLLPDVLAPGETVVAMIPDRDTLILARAPEDGDWAALNDLAEAPGGESLHPRPLRVTRDGIAEANPTD
jgi:hypothetical protein